jgi:RimJ/RimL family protein N-acetyltransferase
VTAWLGQQALGMTALPFPRLGDDVVLLRPWREADIPQQLEAFSDPLFQQHSDWAPTTAGEAVRQLRDNEQARSRGEQINFAVAEPGDADVVQGGASLNNIDHRQARAALGFG